MEKKKFEFLEHTSDIYIEGYGETLEEAFGNTAIGLGHLIVTSSNVEKNICKKIEVSSEDLESLLFDFLSKFLVFQDAESLIFHYVKVEKISKNKGWHLTAKAFGEKFDPKKHEEGTHVKGITYHGMEIKKEKDEYKIKVLVDI